MENNEASEQLASRETKDQYCFGCHKKATNLDCSTCCRSYHRHCAKITRIRMEGAQWNQNEWHCPECIDIDVNSPNETVHNINDLLLHTIELLLEDTSCRKLKRPVDEITNPEYRREIIHPMDLDTIHSNVKNNLYKSSRQFLSDIKWIHHNSYIYFRDDDRFTAAKWLMKLCKEEVLSIDTCADCYANAYIDSESRPWFTLLCAKPHLLLWAKQRNCPFWPAKLLAVNNDKVSVRFFGKSHGRANVPAIDCRLYSQINPSKSYAKQYGVDLSLAQQEVLAYIENFEEKYGAFNYSQTGMPFYASKTSEYLADMVNTSSSSLKMDPDQSESTASAIEHLQNAFHCPISESNQYETTFAAAVDDKWIHKTPTAKKRTKRICSVALPPLASTAPKKYYHDRVIRGIERSHYGSAYINQIKRSPLDSTMLNDTRANSNTDSYLTDNFQVTDLDGSFANRHRFVLQNQYMTEDDSSNNCAMVEPTQLNRNSHTARSTTTSRWEDNIAYGIESNDLSTVFEAIQSSIHARIELMSGDYNNRLKTELDDLLATVHASFKAQLDSETHHMKATIEDLQQQNRLLAEENDRIKAKLHQIPTTEKNDSV